MVKDAAGLPPGTRMVTPLRTLWDEKTRNRKGLANLEPATRVELVTCALRVRCSTTELRRLARQVYKRHVIATTVEPFARCRGRGGINDGQSALHE